jgi:ATP-binding cassette subfamily B multidrug efflux pump
MMMLQSLANIPFMFFGGIIFGMIALPQLWWVMLLLIILVLIVNILVMIPLSKKFETIMKLVEKLNGLTKNNLLGIKVVKSFNQENAENKRFTDISDVLTKYNISVGRAFAVMIPSYTIIVNMAILVSLYLVGNMVSDDPAVIGAFASFMVYLGMIMGAIIMGGFLLVMASQGFVSLNRINEVLNTEPDITYIEGGSNEKLEGSVEFRSVSFKYEELEEHSLHNISFTAKPGEVVGIVGTTGSGKSTLAQLIPRLYDVQEGEVLIGGQNVKRVSKEALRKSVSIVLQKTVLFSGTIEDNLRHGNVNATTKEMERATKISQAYEFIGQMPKLYQTKVEERGANYSGGQKQRLSLARGIIGEPSVLILDDSTSALDARSEELVKKGINKELKGITTFIVAQKISSVVHADKILVLYGGNLVGNGTHKELRETCPAYIEIYETQKGKGVA